MDVYEIINESKQKIMEIENDTIVKLALNIKDCEFEEYLLDSCSVCLIKSEYRLIIGGVGVDAYMCYICRHTFDNIQKITNK